MIKCLIADYYILAHNSFKPISSRNANARVRGCSMGAYPAYVVKSTTTEQLSVALARAKQTI
jgi:hypothetical protein